MPAVDVSEKHLVTPKSVRQALAQWHNLPELGQHPLAQLEVVTHQRQAANDPDTLVGRGRALRALLREAIDQLPHPDIA